MTHSSALDVADLPPRPHAPETRITHVVFPGDTNHHGTLFGGEALSLSFMDSAAFIAAARSCRRKVVTRHLDAMGFSRPIPQGSLVKLVARVVKTGRSSMTVLVELFIEQMYSDHRELGCTGTWDSVDFAQVELSGNAPEIPTESPPSVERVGHTGGNIWGNYSAGGLAAQNWIE